MYDLSLSEARVPAQEDMQVDRVAIGELLRTIATERPQAEALVEVTQAGEIGRRWTYAGLLEDSQRLALALVSRFEPGDHVVVWAPNSPEWVLMEYACALAGLVLVTANPAFQVKELRYVLEHSGAVALFLVDEFRGNPMAQIGKEATEGLTAIREVTDLNDNEALFRHESANPSLPAVTPEDAAQIQYTSGTTGFPKGAVLSHLGLVNNARFYASRCGVDAESTWINIMPMFHTSGCGMVTLGCLQAGCRMVLVSLFDPGVINGLIESERATIILGVPTMVIALQDAFEAKPGDVSTLKVVSCGGAMVAPELVRRVQQNFVCGFSTLYGQTEHCPVITQHHLDDTIDDICNTAGQPIPATEVSIRRVDDNAVASIDEVGEICARGPCAMIGYHANEAATAETIDSDGWLHTGDVAIVDEDGYFSIVDRIKELIKYNGFQVPPAELEGLIATHPKVLDVAVIGIPDEAAGELPKAFVQLAPDVDLTLEELQEFVGEHLVSYKQIRLMEVIDLIPKSASGKILRRELRDR